MGYQDVDYMDQNMRYQDETSGSDKTSVSEFDTPRCEIPGCGLYGCGHSRCGISGCDISRININMAK